MHGGGGKYVYAIETLLESIMKSTICNYRLLKYDSNKLNYVCVVKRVPTYLHCTN